MQSGFIQLYHKNTDAICAELNAGLLAPQACISPKFLYDGLGSKLFAAICELPEYYPTRTESLIFEQYRAEIARSTGRGSTLIDLGAGNCEKAARLFSALQPVQYVPVDISVDFLRESIEYLRYRYPQIRMTALGMDFSSALELPDAVRIDKRLFFYPGSSIGNFTPEEAAAFLGRVRDACRADGGLLIGVDLIKDEALLYEAYDDAIGLTAAFNLNMLQHLNRLLGANFKPRDWRHVCLFNAGESRVELHVEALRSVTVAWEGGERRFSQGERIHTENSYKYTPEKFLQLLERAGFAHVNRWSDPHGWFMLCHAQAV